MTSIVRSIKGSQAEAPVHLSGEIGHLKVVTHDTNAETIVRGVTKAKRNPASALHKMIANLRLPVSVTVKQADITTHGEVNLNAKVDDLAFNLNPDVSEDKQENKRSARLGITAGKLSVDVEKPVGVVANTVRQLLPPDPLESLPEPLGLLTDASVLDRLPDTVCTHGTLNVSNLDVVMERDVHQRTTKASPDTPVWFVEGKAHSHIQAGKVDVSSKGSLGVSANLNNVSLDALTSADKDEVTIVVNPSSEGDVSATVDLKCHPDLMKTLGEAARNNKMHQILLDGQGTAKLKGKTSVSFNKKTAAVDVQVEGFETSTDKTTLIKSPDVHIRLPQSIHGQAGGFHVVASPPVEYRGVREKRTEVTLDRLDIDGDGDVVIDSDFSEDGSPVHHFVIPVRGQGHIRGTRLENIRLQSANKLTHRSRTVLHPGTIEVASIKSNDIRVEQLKLNLDHELNGDLTLTGANVRFNDLLNTKTIYTRDQDTGEEKVELIDPPPLPKALRWLLKNKTLTMNGAVPVKGGCVDVRDIKANRLRVSPEEGSLGNKLMCGVMNTAIRGALFLMGGRVLHLDQRGNEAVLRSPLFKGVPIPLPQAASQHLVLNEAGAFNLAAMQNLATGLYCLPRHRQRVLDNLLKDSLSGTEQVPRLDRLLTEVQSGMRNPEKLQEALYLINGLPVEHLIEKAKQDVGVKSALERAASLAMMHQRGRVVAVDIFNQGLELGIKPDNEQLQTLINDIQYDAPEATDFAELLFRLSRAGLAVPLLKDIVKDGNGSYRTFRTFLQLSRIEWGWGLYKEALEHIRDAALQVDKENVHEVTGLLQSWVSSAEDPQSQEILQARLLLGTITLRSEVKGGNEQSFVAAVRELEELAIHEDEHGIAQQARNVLKDRCSYGYKVSERPGSGRVGSLAEPGF